jgi:pantothenate kinase type III
MATSLEQNTDIRLSETTHSLTLEPGHSTEAAVFNGNLAAVVSLVQRVLWPLAEQEPDLMLYISGGDGELLAAQIDFGSTEIVTTLVLDGLAIACPIQG